MLNKIKDLLDENKDEIISDYRKGNTLGYIAEKYKCNSGNVFHALRRWKEPVRKTQIDQEDKTKILQMYSDGVTAYRISKDLGLGYDAVGRFLRRSGFDIAYRKKKRIDPLIGHKEEIVNRYQSGESCKLIGENFGCGPGSITNLLKKVGIKKRTNRDLAYPVDESFFDVIDNEVKAYCLGYFMADGCNRPSVPSISILITDRDILVRIMKEMKFGGIIKEIKPQKEHWKILYRIDIGSRRLSDALARVGCVANKTYLGTFPDTIIVPEYLQRHLLRGWMDGDGTIAAIGSSRVHMKIVGNEAVCRGISDCVNRHLGIPGCVCVSHKGKNHITYSFSVGGRNRVKLILDWLYKDSTIYLQRKHDKYLQVIAEV